MSKKPKIIAHRGYSEHYKGNSLQSYLKALEAGADFIEIDIRQSADGDLVCVHDPVIWFKRVDRLSTNQLQFRGVSKLSDILKSLPKDANLLFDIKIKNAQALDKLADQVRQSGFAQNTVFGVRSMKGAEYFLREMPQSQVLGFFGNYNDYDAFFKAGGHFARVWENDLSSEVVNKIKQGNPKRKIWITAYKSKFVKVGKVDQKRLADILGHDVDGVILNDPALMKSMRDNTKKPRGFWKKFKF